MLGLHHACSGHFQSRPSERAVGEMSRRKQANPKPLKVDEERVGQESQVKGANSLEAPMKVDNSPQVNESYSEDYDDEDRPLVIDTSCDLGGDQGHCKTASSNEGNVAQLAESSKTVSGGSSPSHDVISTNVLNEDSITKTSQSKTETEDMAAMMKNYAGEGNSSSIMSTDSIRPLNAVTSAEASGHSTPLSYTGNGLSRASSVQPASPASPHSSAESGSLSPSQSVTGKLPKKLPNTTTATPTSNPDPGCNQNRKFNCPICPEVLGNSHDLTQHIRSHNSGVTGATNNNMCTVCGKVLSSQSSLDRHMLVHSGERPFKCKVCKMAFTTNGNMHRHMRIHGKDGDLSSDSTRGGAGRKPKGNKSFSSLRDLSVPSMVGFQPIHVPAANHSFHGTTFSRMETGQSPGQGEKRSREDAADEGLYMPKRRVSHPVDRDLNSPSSRDSMEDFPPPSDDTGYDMGKEIEMNDDSDQLHCPLCSKSFLCTYGLESHLETHSSPSLHCQDCSLSFKTERGLQMHNLLMHSANKQSNPQPARSNSPDNNGSTNGDAEPSVGFHDLDFMEFSNKKFSLAAKAFCEKKPRLPSSSYHHFSCKDCEKTFPCKSALNLHECNHIPEKLSSCPICFCDFDDSQKLHLHMIKHLSDKALADCQEKLDLTNCKGQDSFMKHNFLAYFDLKSTDDSADQGETIADTAVVEKRQNNDYFAKIGQAFSAKLARQMAEAKALKLQAENVTENSFSKDSEGMESFKERSRLSAIEDMIKASTSGLNANGLAFKSTSFQAALASASAAVATAKLQSDLPFNSPVLTSSPVSGQTVSMPAHLRLPSHTTSMMHGMSHGSQRVSPLSAAVSPLTDDDSGSGDAVLLDKVSAKGMFDCKYCEKTFTNYRALKGHTRTHLGLSPYKCNLCTYSSADKSTLIRHLRTHNGERPFQCLICDFAFTTKANCERHVRKKHSKFSKDDIEKSIGYNKFVSADASKKINATNFHSPDTVCKYCGVDFKFFRALKHHLRSHSSCRQKPFLCQKCSIGFSTKANCVRHIQKQHIDVPQNLIERYIQVNEPAGFVANNDKDGDNLSDNSMDISYGSACSSPSVGVKFAHSTPVSRNDTYGPAPRPAHSTPARSVHALSHPMMNLPVKIEPPETNTDMPLDFSVKPEKNGTPPPTHKPVLKPKISDDVTELPIDLSIKKEPETERKCDKLPGQFTPSRPQQCQYCPQGFPNRLALDRHQRERHGISMSLHSRPNRSITSRSIPSRRAVPANSHSTGSGSDCDLASIHKMMDITNPHKFQAFFQLPDSFEQSHLQPSMETTDNKPTFASLSRPETTDLENENNFDDKSSPSGSVDENFNQKNIIAHKRPIIYEGETTPTSQKEFSFNDEETMNYSMDEDKGSNVEIKEEDGESYQLDTSADGQKHDGEGFHGKKKRNSYADSPHKLHCPYCPRTFPWVSSLTRHLLTHTGQKPYKCPRCPVTFSTKSNRERHLIRKHGVNMLDPASRQTMDRPFKCHLCIFSSFSTKSNLLKHYQDRHPGSNIPDTILRGEGNVDTSDLDLNDMDEGQQMENYEVNSEPEMEENCKYDDEDLAKIELVIAEESDRMPAPVSTRPLNPERDNYNVDKITECWKCAAKFLSRKLLVRHLKEHNIDFPFKCYLCDASFETRKECLYHQEKVHSDDWPHLQEKNKVDDIETFAEAMEELVAKNYRGGDLDNGDMSEVIAGEEAQIDAATSDYIQRKVYCSLCPKRFWSLQDLRRHMRSHTGEKPFECDLCQKRFTLKHSMMRHRKKHTEMPDSLSASDDEDSLHSEDTVTKLGEKKNLVIESVLNRIRANQEHRAPLSHFPNPKFYDSDIYQKKKAGYFQDRKSPLSRMSPTLGSTSRDILQSLLGVEDSAIDEMLESADSAAERLGVK